MQKIISLLILSIMLISIVPNIAMGDDETLLSLTINLNIDIPDSVPNASPTTWPIDKYKNSAIDNDLDITVEGYPTPSDLFYQIGKMFIIGDDGDLYQYWLLDKGDYFYLNNNKVWAASNEFTECYKLITEDTDLSDFKLSDYYVGYYIAIELKAIYYFNESSSEIFVNNEKVVCDYIGEYAFIRLDLGKINEDLSIGENTVVIEEDTTPIEATQERIDKYGIPTVFIGEDKPEIKVLTAEDTYEYNENQYSAEAKIIIENGRTYLGLRDIAYSLGIDPMAVKWNENTKTASISKSGAKIELTEGSNLMTITYRGYIYHKEIDSPAFIRDGRTYVPFRAIFEEFGYKVDWDSETRTITCK